MTDERLREALRGAESTIESALRAQELPKGLRSLFVATLAEVRATLAATPEPTPTLTAETFHDKWVLRGMTCDGTHAVGEALCQNVVAVLTAARLSQPTQEPS